MSFVLDHVRCFFGLGLVRGCVIVSGGWVGSACYFYLDGGIVV